MTDNRKYWTIGAIVDHWIASNDLSSNFFKKGLAWGLWGLRELNLDIFQDVKICSLEVTERKTVTLPPDCVDPVLVAVQRGQYLVTLAVNDDLSKLQRDGTETANAMLLSQNPPNGIDMQAYSGYNLGNGMFSLGHGLPSQRHFQVVQRDACKELVLDLNFACTHVYLEYISDGFDPNGETVVTPYFADYILKYIEHEYEKKNNPNKTESSIRRMAQDLAFAVTIVRGRVNQIDKATFLALSRKHTKLTPKI